ncbi:hypothetical protein WM05_05620 [Burkholderia ubonensis]|nr:hypothetical protein WM05_05620 [Burkholderia ubonensis]
MLIGFGNACFADRSCRDDAVMRATVSCLSAGVRLNDMIHAAGSGWPISRRSFAGAVRQRGKPGCPESRVACFRRVSLRMGKEWCAASYWRRGTKQSGRRGA